jgi:hypothetical protein
MGTIVSPCPQQQHLPSHSQHASLAPAGPTPTLYSMGTDTPPYGLPCAAARAETYGCSIPKVLTTGASTGSAEGGLTLA